MKAVLLRRAMVSFIGFAAALAAATPFVARGAVAPGGLQFASDFSHPNGPNHLVTNEWAFWNPRDPDRVLSRSWEVTSGSLFSVHGFGWTGSPDDGSVYRYSIPYTGSDVFRMRTVRRNFGDVVQEVDARINGFAGSLNTPDVPWDGVVLWPRYLSPFHLYFAYIMRKDGRVAITKKCPGEVPGGGFYNGGSYFSLTSEKYRGRLRLGYWYRIASSVQDQPDGSVTIRIFRDGRLLARASDRGTGCAPLRSPARLGIRSDNVDANFAHYRVYSLSATVPPWCPDAFVGPRRRVLEADARRRGRTRRPTVCPATFRSQPRP